MGELLASELSYECWEAGHYSPKEGCGKGTVSVQECLVESLLRTK